MDYKIKKLKKKQVTKGLFDTLSSLSGSVEVDVRRGRKIFKEIKRNKNHFIYAAVDKKSEEAIGLATLLIEPKFIHGCGYLGHIEDVVVNKNYQGQGVGRRLLERVVKQAKKKGCYRVILNCSDKNVGFYEKIGFRQREEREMALELKRE